MGIEMERQLRKERDEWIEKYAALNELRDKAEAALAVAQQERDELNEELDVAAGMLEGSRGRVRMLEDIVKAGKSLVSPIMLRRSEARVQVLEEALRVALDELGVPGVGYPAPVANAHKILSAALAGVPVPVETPGGCYCGYLGWTVEAYGRTAHKHGCPARTDDFCQAHPQGCPVETAAQRRTLSRTILRPPPVETAPQFGPKKDAFLKPSVETDQP